MAAAFTAQSTFMPNNSLTTMAVGGAEGAKIGGKGKDRNHWLWHTVSEEEKKEKKFKKAWDVFRECLEKMQIKN
jgi:hypothetical protein